MFAYLNAYVKPAGGTATHTRRKINVDQGTGSILGRKPRFSILFWTVFMFPFRFERDLGALLLPAVRVGGVSVDMVGGRRGGGGLEEVFFNLWLSQVVF